MSDTMMTGADEQSVATFDDKAVGNSSFVRNTGGQNDAGLDDGWTVQQGPNPSGVDRPGYQVLPHQLPDPRIARAAGIPPQSIPPTLVVGGEEALAGYYEGEAPSEGPDRVHGWTGESHEPELYEPQQ